MIATTTSTAEYAGDGTTYAIDFPLADATHLVAIETVTATGVETTLDSGLYTFTPETDLDGRITGGTVVTDDAIAATSTILFKRVTPKEQNFDLTPGGAFSAEALENVFDKLTMIAQEIARDFAAADAVLTAADVAIKARLDALEA